MYKVESIDGSSFFLTNNAKFNVEGSKRLLLDQERFIRDITIQNGYSSKVSIQENDTLKANLFFPPLDL